MNQMVLCVFFFLLLDFAIAHAARSDDIFFSGLTRASFTNVFNSQLEKSPADLMRKLSSWLSLVTPDELLATSVDGKNLLHAIIGSVPVAISDGGELADRTKYFKETKGQTTVMRQPYIDKLDSSVSDVIDMLLNAIPTHAHNFVLHQDAYGDSPLHVASRLGLLTTCGVLLDHGALPNLSNKHGQTPLHRAALHGSLQVAKLLIQNSANPDIPDNYGATFKDYVAGAGSPFSGTKIYEYLSIKPRAPRHDAEPSHEREASVCKPDGGYNIGKIPEPDVCDIDKRTNLSANEFFNEYVLQGRPVLLRNVLSLSERCPLSMDALLSQVRLCCS